MQQQYQLGQQCNVRIRRNYGREATGNILDGKGTFVRVISQKKPLGERQKTLTAIITKIEKNCAIVKNIHDLTNKQIEQLRDPKYQQAVERGRHNRSVRLKVGQDVEVYLEKRGKYFKAFCRNGVLRRKRFESYDPNKKYKLRIIQEGNNLTGVFIGESKTLTLTIDDLILYNTSVYVRGINSVVNLYLNEEVNIRTDVDPDEKPFVKLPSGQVIFLRNYLDAKDSPLYNKDGLSSVLITYQHPKKTNLFWGFLIPYGLTTKQIRRMRLQNLQQRILGPIETLRVFPEPVLSRRYPQYQDTTADVNQATQRAFIPGSPLDLFTAKEVRPIQTLEIRYKHIPGKPPKEYILCKEVPVLILTND